MKDLFRLERHPLGTRVYALGMRIHEWHLGAAILGAVALGAAIDRVGMTFTAILATLAGSWLVAKDWHDLVPSRRDTAAWKLGLHRSPHPLRTFRRADPLPTLAAVGAIAVAIVNLVSAVTPNVAWRGHALLAIEPLAAMRLSHALAIPAAWTLLVTGLYLAKRRSRALRTAIVLLGVLALLNLAKGLDVEEALADLAAATLLWLGRSSFYVKHEPLRAARRTLTRIVVFALGCLLVAGVTVWIGAPSNTSLQAVAHTTADFLLWRPGPLAFHDELAQLGLAVGLLGALTVIGCAAIVFRPLLGPRLLPDAQARAAAAELVRRHGSDTLAYFKLRRDKHYLFSADGAAFVGYRIENGVLLLSGDPVGPPETFEALLGDLRAFAGARGLKLGAVGASGPLCPLYEELGLRTLYLGDEAIVELESFSLEGRAIRKIRQSVSRLTKAGYTAELVELSALDPRELCDVERVL
jgi:lysyl-tRNA synthetase, class II